MSCAPQKIAHASRRIELYQHTSEIRYQENQKEMNFFVQPSLSVHFANVLHHISIKQQLFSDSTTLRATLRATNKSSSMTHNKSAQISERLIQIRIFLLHATVDERPQEFRKHQNRGYD